MSGIEAVAEILASLIGANCGYMLSEDQTFDKRSTDIVNVMKHDCECPIEFAISSNINKPQMVSPALLALQCYKSDYNSSCTRTPQQELAKHVMVAKNYMHGI
jgi:hypothetical protein